MNEKDKVFFMHILESIKEIETFTKGVSKKELENNKEKLNAVVRSIEIIGDSSKNISNEFKNSHKEIEWKEIAGTRDILIHHYFGVDIEEVWKIVSKDVIELKAKMLKILELNEKSKNTKKLSPNTQNNFKNTNNDEK